MTLGRRRPLAVASERVLLGSVRLAGPVVHGYVLDPERESEGLVVELLLDGLPLQIARADLYNAMLADEGARNPFHGFHFAIPANLFETGAVAEVRLANDGVLVGRSLSLRQDARPVADALGPGAVDWLGGLRFGGWLAGGADEDLFVRALIDENQILEARASGWTTIDRGGIGIAVSAFEFDLPARFADARAHKVSVVTSAGLLLPPGPVPFVAFDEGLERFLSSRADVASERIRGAFYDRLFPQSLPFSALEAWLDRFAEAPPPEPQVAVAAVALIGEEGLDASLASLQQQEIGWVAGVLPWRGASAEFDPAELAAFLHSDAEGCDVVVFAVAGTLFRPGALQTMAALLQADGRSELAYADVAVATPEGQVLPLGLPGFDRERFLEQGYAASFFALTRAAAIAAVAAGADSLFRMFDAGDGADGPTNRQPVHIPHCLATVPQLALDRAAPALAEAGRRFCDDHGFQARIEPVATRRFPAVRLRRRPPRSLVSIVVAARNGADDLRRCMAGLKAQVSTHDLEFIVVDNDSSEAETADLLSDLATDGVQIIRLRGPRNVARSCNCGAAIASGTYVVFLDQHVVLTSPDAIDEMVSRCSAEGTGAVGAMLTTPGGALHDAGLVLNFRDGATRAFAGHAVGEAGYGELLAVAREVSAVSVDVLMVARAAFMAAGGMDEVVFPLFFPSVALCLTLRARGHRTVFTPHVRAQWNGATSGHPADPTLRFDRELEALRSTFPDDLGNDMFYSPILALNGPLFSALAWPPRDRSPRRRRSAEPPDPDLSTEAASPSGGGGG